jgi:hypothetical protein
MENSMRKAYTSRTFRIPSGEKTAVDTRSSCPRSTWFSRSKLAAS